MSNQLDLIVLIFHWITIKESRQMDEKETSENKPWIKGNHNTWCSKEIYLLALLSSKICLIISPLPCLHDIICYYQVWSIAVYANLNSKFGGKMHPIFKRASTLQKLISRLQCKIKCANSTKMYLFYYKGYLKVIE